MATTFAQPGYLNAGDGAQPSAARQRIARPDSSVVAIDVVYRRRIGERPTPEEYRDRFPSESAAIDRAFDASGAAHGGPVGDAVTVGVPDGSVPTIPGYTVLEELGRGGMGVVFKATAEQPNRFVALKMILSGDLASTEAGARFLKEAEAVARLQHPQVVLALERQPPGSRPNP
jgi:eukaryotic-like serine/threonine-protein kinase